jgi:hypothetical protein
MSRQSVNPNGSNRAASYLNAATVHANGVSDHLEGEGAQDWYFAKLKKRTALLQKLKDIFKRFQSQTIGRVVAILVVKSDNR